MLKYNNEIQVVSSLYDSKLETMIEPSSPIRKIWKPELYKIQLEAPTPKPLNCARPLADHNDQRPNCYGNEYHGRIGHVKAEELLKNKPDGTYIIRRSPSARDYFTLSLRFNNRSHHYKLYFDTGRGHYLQEQTKYFDTIKDLVADGLVNFYMNMHAASIIQEINQQTTESCYQQSPYMTLNRRKLRSLSSELRRSLPNNTSIVDVTTDKVTTIGEKNISTLTIDHNGKENSIETDVDTIWPFVYEKPHVFKFHTFKGLNWCEVCANFLWGFTAQGVKCEDCGIIAHSKCSELVPAKCIPDLKRIRGVFGTDLTTVVQLYQNAVPFVVQRCVEEVELRGMLQEGIYRVSGFADEIDTLKMALDRDGEKTDMSDTAYNNINVIAGTLKLFLRLLPVPLITFQAYPKFMEASRLTIDNNQIKQMSLAVKNLPLAHYNCLKYMMKHLKKVASHYNVNKMNAHNLATVFAPTLIATPQHLTNLTEEIFMLSFLITNSSLIFN